MDDESDGRELDGGDTTSIRVMDGTYNNTHATELKTIPSALLSGRSEPGTVE